MTFFRKNQVFALFFFFCLDFLKNGSEKPALSKIKSSFTRKISSRKSFDKPSSDISSNSYFEERKKEMRRRLKKYLSNLFLLFTSHIIEVVDPTNRSKINKEEVYFNFGMETLFIKMNQSWLKERNIEVLFYFLNFFLFFFFFN